jgi:Ca2+-binding EF-hand superfamily protein
MSEEQREMSIDIKNDILLAFNLYKNENNKINKLKLRTLLFSFVMYKNSAEEINKYIENQTKPEQEEFDFDEVCEMVNLKLKASKEKEADEVFNYICQKNDNHFLRENDFVRAFKNNEIDISLKEIKEMMKFIANHKNQNEEDEKDEENFEGNEEEEEKEIEKVSKAQFKGFYI